MNTSTHLTESTALSRRILSQDDIDCSVMALAPGEEIACEDAHWTQEHLLFVIEGGVLVRMGDVTRMMGRDEALLIAPGRNSTITADASGWARLLLVDFTRRTIVEPPIFTVPPYAGTP